MTHHAPAPSPHDELLRREDRGPVAILTLNRPQARNALSEAMLHALSAGLDAVSNDAHIRVVVLTGTAPAFCAGHDLKEMTDHRGDADKGRAFYAHVMGLCSGVMQQIPDCPKPVIAAVNGIATAAGCQLVAACDLALASTEARFATPGVNIGLFCSTPMVPISRNLPRKHAMELLLTGDMIPADEAMRIGLVNGVVPPAALMAETLALADKIAAKSPEAIAFGKRAFYAQLDMPLASAYGHATCIMVDNMLAADAQEGIGAFLGKRTPDWPSARDT